MSEEKRMGFGTAMDRLMVWIATALLGWLCYSTMTLKEQMASVLARTDMRADAVKSLEDRFNKHLEEEAQWRMRK